MEKIAIAATIFLMLAIISVASVSAVDYEAPIWYLDQNGDGLVDDTDGDGKTTINDWALLYNYRNFIADNYPEMLPLFDYNGDGVTDKKDLEYALRYLTGYPPKVAPPAPPSVKPHYYYAPNGDWYPNGEKVEYEKKPSITIGWDPEDAPKIERPSPSPSGFFPPLKRFG